MDLNQLYSDHQAAQMRAGSAIPGADRDVYLDDAASLAARIGEFQQSLGAAAAFAWTAKASQRALELRVDKCAPLGAACPSEQTVHDGEGLRRQKEMTHLALLVLGRDAGLAFMNNADACLGGRPLDLVDDNSDNVPMVEELLRKMAKFETMAKPMQPAC
ncbi:MAG: hypothetical protein HKO08_09215 [Erythrobacter sp.]|nr:hypothetical protein [Erythrobacter sp.]